MTHNQGLMDPDAGRAAYEALKPRLDALTSLRRVTVDVQKVAIAAVAVARKINEPEIRARLARQPPEDFDIGHLDRLEQAALATIYTSMQYRHAAPAASKAKLSAALANVANELRQRMLKVLEYNLGDRPEIARRLDDIRQGSGHMDLAQDLWRLGQMYEELAPELAMDRRLYRAEDRKAASELVQQIHIELGENKNDDAARWADAMQRAYTFLIDTYNEIYAAVHWVFRHQNPEAIAPSLFTATRARRRTKDEMRSGDNDPESGSDPEPEPT